MSWVITTYKRRRVVTQSLLPLFLDNSYVLTTLSPSCGVVVIIYKIPKNHRSDKNYSNIGTHSLRVWNIHTFNIFKCSNIHIFSLNYNSKVWSSTKIQLLPGVSNTIQYTCIKWISYCRLQSSFVLKLQLVSLKSLNLCTGIPGVSGVSGLPPSRGSWTSLRC